MCFNGHHSTCFSDPFIFLLGFDRIKKQKGACRCRGQQNFVREHFVLDGKNVWLFHHCRFLCWSAVVPMAQKMKGATKSTILYIFLEHSFSHKYLNILLIFSGWSQYKKNSEVFGQTASKICVCGHMQIFSKSQY